MFRLNLLLRNLVAGARKCRVQSSPSIGLSGRYERLKESKERWYRRHEYLLLRYRGGMEDSCSAQIGVGRRKVFGITYSTLNLECRTSAPGVGASLVIDH